MNYYVKDDCFCGYATNNTQSCNVKDCKYYIKREVKMAQCQFKCENAKLLHDQENRIKAAIEGIDIYKTDPNNFEKNIRGKK